MDIMKNSRNAYLDEILFYYYAARSYIKLSMMDSAYYVKSIIPVPNNSLDSMNHYKLLSEIAWVEHRHEDYADYLSKSKDINDKIFNASSQSDISRAELKWDSDMAQTKYKKILHGRLVFISIILICIILLIILCATRIIKKKIIVYQDDISSSQNELQKTIDFYETKIIELEASMAEQKDLLVVKEKTLEAVIKKNDILQNQHGRLAHQVATIVRYRLSALNELYYEIRVKSDSKTSPNKYPIPLMSLIRDMNDKKQLMHMSPRKSFWEKLKRSVEGEYPGITTFVEQNCQSTKARDHQLFWLLCAKVSPQIIKLCMNYTSTVTVSNYKRTIIKELMGLDLKFDQFIQLYLDGRYDQLVKK